MDNKEMTAQFKQKVVELLELLGYDADIDVEMIEVEDRSYLSVKITVEEGAAELIGQHGRNLDSLSTVLGLMVPEVDSRLGLILDINDYRDERSKYIEDLANKAVEQVLNNAQQVELLPMKPWERRIVHMTLAAHSDVVTESVGEGEDRRVVIKPLQDL